MYRKISFPENSIVMRRKIVCSKIKEVSILCPMCETETPCKALTYINTAENPELREQIVFNDINKFKCSFCGCTIQSPFIYDDPKRKFAILYMPGGELKNLNEFEIYAVKRNYENCRIVLSHKDLMEKIRIFERDLNDKAIEICKFEMFNCKPVNLYFASKYNDKLLFKDLHFDSEAYESFFSDEPPVELPYSFYEEILLDHEYDTENIEGKWVIVDDMFAIITGNQNTRDIIMAIEEAENNMALSHFFP